MQEPVWQDVMQDLPHQNIPDSDTLSIHPFSIQVFADPMLKNVFVNLLDNSLRHGKSVSAISVSGEKGEWYSIAWEDDGIGIPSDDKRSLRGGMGKIPGWGLFLAREILSLTGILIQETNEEGKGHGLR